MLPYEIKKVINMMLKEYSTFIIPFMIIMIVLGELKIGSIFSLGLTLAISNFILSGVILKNTIEKKNKIMIMLLPFSYIARMSIIVLIGLCFVHEFKFISAYILGFIANFPILFICWFKNRRLNKNGVI